MHINQIKTCYPRLAGMLVQLNFDTYGSAGDPLTGFKDLLDKNDVFQLTGEVIELRPIVSEIFKKHGGPKFARVMFEVGPMLTDTKYWITNKFTASGPEHRFITSFGKELTPDYFLQKR